MKPLTMSTKTQGLGKQYTVTWDTDRYTDAEGTRLASKWLRENRGATDEEIAAATFETSGSRRWNGMAVKTMKILHNLENNLTKQDG